MLNKDDYDRIEKQMWVSYISYVLTLLKRKWCKKTIDVIQWNKDPLLTKL